MTKLRVEVIEPQGFKEGNIVREYGDVFTSENGAEYVRVGWCKNIETGETNERTPGNQAIEVQNVTTTIT